MLAVIAFSAMNGGMCAPTGGFATDSSIATGKACRVSTGLFFCVDRYYSFRFIAPD